MGKRNVQKISDQIGLAENNFLFSVVKRTQNKETIPDESLGMA